MDLHAQSSTVLRWIERMTKQYEADSAKQETFWKEQKASQETFWKEQKASWAKLEASWGEQKASWAKQEKMLNMEVYRAQGKLSSRGIFERLLELAAAEQGLKGRLNATLSIKKIGNMDVEKCGKGEF